MFALTCPFCSAKIKKGRLRCPRCNELLPTEDPAAAPPSVVAGYRDVAPIIGGVLSLAVLVVAVTLSTGTQPDVPPAAAPAPARVPAAKRSAPITDEAAALDKADPKYGGTAAYARGDVDTALKRYERAVQDNANDADALNNLGQVLTRMGRPLEAIPHFQRALSLYPHVWAYRFNLARAHGQSGNWRQAVEDYRVAATLNADDYVTHYNLGMALHKLGNEPAAITEYQKAIELAPGEASFHLSLGISYERLNRAEDAVKAYEEYLKMDPSAPGAEKIKAQIEALRKPA